MLGVVVAFGIGSALAQNVCTPAFQGGSPIGSLLVVAPVAETVRLCSPYHDIDLLVMFFGLTLLGFGLFLVVVGGAAVFWGESVKVRGRASRPGMRGKVPRSRKFNPA